jgi:hypothetical protein
LPGFALPDRIPKIGKRRFGHVAVTHDIVGRAQKLVLVKAANINECLIDEGDFAAGIGSRYQDVVFLEIYFPVGDRSIISHLLPPNGLVGILAEPSLLRAI